MKFAEFIEQVKDNGVLVARVSSGRSFCGETARFVRHNFASGYHPESVTIETESGKRLRVNDVYGKAVIAGKLGKEHFVASVERMDSEDFFKSAIC